MLSQLGNQICLALLKSNRLIPFFMLFEEPVQLHRRQTNFFHAQKDIQIGGLGMFFRNLSEIRATLTILWERVGVHVFVPCSCFLSSLYRADDTATVVLTMHSNISCDNDCLQGWAMIWTISRCHLLTCQDLRSCSCMSIQFVNIWDCEQQLIDIDF